MSAARERPLGGQRPFATGAQAAVLATIPDDEVVGASPLVPAITIVALALGTVLVLVGTMGACALAPARLTLVLVVSAAGVLATGLGLFAVRRWFTPAVLSLRAELARVRERQIARHLRLSLRTRAAPPATLELTAVSAPAADQGLEQAQDHHDVICTPQGTWIALGEVGGAGLRGGLVGLMIQSVLAALLARREARPAELLQVLGRVLVENVRRRLRVEAEVRVMLCRLSSDGAFVHAGAHHDLLVWRAGRGHVDRIAGGPRSGPLGRTAVTELELALAPGDTVLLHTTGVVAARNAAGEAFGLERLAAALAAARGKPVADIGAHLLATLTAFAPHRQAPATLIVLRHLGV